jgi:bifunctional NMN adenylyltransferase/nudix hydrolase
MSGNERYDFGVMLGRYNIVTEAHLTNARIMAEKSKFCIIGIGSTNQSRDTRNSYTYEERKEMWELALGDELLTKFQFFGQEDLGNTLRWASSVESQVDRIIKASGHDPEQVSIGLFGHRKDATSFYLDDFPRYVLENLPNVDGINASDLRETYLRSDNFSAWAKGAKAQVPQKVIGWLETFHGSAAYNKLANEARRDDHAMKPYKVKSFEFDNGLPHDVIFTEATAVIVQGNRVLMRKKSSYPGKGYWALPEGPIRLREGEVQAAMRIAFEKTKIDVSETVLRKALKDSWVRTDPYRTTRGRSIAFPSVFKLEPTPKGKTAEERRKSMALPRIRASDDTAFFTFDQIRKMRSEIYADHFIIIDQALERLGYRSF